MHLRGRSGLGMPLLDLKGNLRDLLGKSVRRSSLEAWLGEIPYVQPVCSIWKREFDPDISSMVSSDSVPRHISLLDD